MTQVDEDGVLEADMLVGFFPDDIAAKGGEVLRGCAEQSKTPAEYLLIKIIISITTNIYIDN